MSSKKGYSKPANSKQSSTRKHENKNKSQTENYKKTGMSSKKEHSKPTNSYESSRGKQENKDKSQKKDSKKHENKNKSQKEDCKKHENKNKSQKEDYKKKSMHSPAFPSLASEKVVFFPCKANSNPSNLSASSSKSNYVNLNKGTSQKKGETRKNNIHRPAENSHTLNVQNKNFAGSSLNTIYPPHKNEQRNLPQVSQFGSRRFMSLASQTHHQRFNQSNQHHGKFHYSGHKNSLNSHVQTTQFRHRNPQTQGNSRHPSFHQKGYSIRPCNQYQRGIHGIHSQQPWVVNNISVNSSFEKRRTCLWKKNKTECDSRIKIKELNNTKAEPLFSFQCGNSASEKNLDLINFDDDGEDDDKSVISDYSVDSIANLIDLSNDSIQPSTDFNLIDLTGESYHLLSNINENISDDGTDSYSSDESSESTASEFSVNSSILSNGSRLNIIKPNMTKEAFISVFWDIENCALPSQKSAVDFANYVRDKFYEGRTEVQFTAACDVSNLNPVVVRELDEASITLIHISSMNKNAADKKIQGLLQKFQLEYRKSNSAVVLISSDSDFSPFLLDMRYQHHIFVNLICKKQTRDSLTTAANEYAFLEDVIMKLPDRNAKNDMKHILVITNLPQLNYKQIKNFLCEKLNNFNCRITVNASGAKIVFKDHSVCNRAMNSLKGIYLGGNALHIAYQTELHEIPKKVKNMKNSCLSHEKNVIEPNGSKHTLPDSPEGKVSNGNYVASLSICVSTFLGNVEHWRNIFENTWKTKEFSIQWEGSLLDGYFLVNFRSLKKAQKVKKLLVKNQINDPEAPKFLKLIKSGNDLISLDGHILNSLEDLNKNKIEEYIQIIEKKKLKLLKNHESFLEKMKHHDDLSQMYGVSEAVNDKLRECIEQKETFINFVNMTINIVKTLYFSDNLDLKLKELFSDFTRECNCFSIALPIYAKKENILKGIQNHQVLIIRAETGSGKSTQLTQYIWREKYICGDGKIICTQPRKIAAISLAKYVSSQIGCKLGDIVGYQVGMSSKLSVNTKIVYVTDFTMLKMLISEDLNGVSCIIIDEAHERTIYTDILLGMIKQYLPRYPHLKVVITSATIDTSIFQKYFTLNDNSIMQISGRTFPVEDVWLDDDVTVDWDYFGKTINKAFEILTEGPGDVLSFLTTPLETEKAFEKFTEKLKGSREENTVKVFYLHGKMNYEEQQKVYEKTPNGMRKIIFTTNCAETSITIPGIKYVIDCGLVEESQYDADRNMNILSVGFVSKSSAEQRKGRAGRTQKGKCYRLFSKANYENMANNTDPEILRINLGQAVMKLMKMGVGSPLQFEFLQSPPTRHLVSAMDQLKYLKAVDETTSSLTEFGSKMAVLPFEPRLCHLIFQGYDYDIGYDSLVVAALVTMSHTIFFRNSENKDEADKKKRRFCESESDFISYLEVYKEWVDVPKNLKSQWCVINCINARSMRTVQELVSEIVLILQKELKLKVKLKFSSETTYDILIKAIFYSFSQNLSLFSGHPKFGYKSLSTSDRLIIHPSSSLCSFGLSTPKFVVYDTILKTSQTFMVNISPVTEEMIFDAVNFHNLPIDLIAVKNLSEFEIVPYPFNLLGEKIIVNNFIGKKGMKRRDLERKITEFTNSEFVEIDINVPNGCVTVFSIRNKFDQICSVVMPIINDARQVLYNEESNIYFDDRSLTAILGAGGVINDVVLPGEFTDLKLILKEEGNIESVTKKLSTCGIITEIREWKKYFKVTFKTPVSAGKALVTYYNEKDFSLQSIHRSLPMGKDHMYKVLMTFYRRPCIGVAYITVDQPIPPFLLPSSVTYNDVVARVSLSKKTGDIRITDLPLNTDKNLLESVASSLLPSNIKITKCIISRKKPYESAIEEIESIKRNILSLFAEFTFKGNIEVYLKKPTARDFTWNATVFLKDCHAGETAVNILKNRKHVANFLGGFILKPELQTYLYCKSEVFSVVKGEIEEALKFFKTNQPTGNELNIEAVTKWTDKVEIKIMSNNITDITDARKFIHRILSGDKLNFPKISDQEKLFTHVGKEFMKGLIENNQDCFILQNDYSKTITIFGKETSINVLKMTINTFLISLENNDCKDISLKTNTGKSILKELLKKYGYDLQLLQEECNASDIKFIKSKQMITVQGNSSSILKCEDIIQDIKKKMESDVFEVNGETCPICCDEVSEDKHRLEYCGHVYCTECLLHLFQNSEDIPLNCEVCQYPIVLADILWTLNKRQTLEKVVYEKFLRYFASSRCDISFCPSPDCNMIFRVTEESSIFRCPQCGNSICTHCEELYHFGMSCSLYKCTKSDSDHSLKVWMQEDPNNRKLCPSCSSPIEKNGGCNHMTCWKCKVHICWLCLKVCSSGDEVYIHLGACPRANVD